MTIFNLVRLSVMTFIITLMFSYSFAEEQLLDLEKFYEGLVLEEKQIEIPGYPHAFNASIVRWNGSLLMSFRFIPDPKSSFTCYLGIVFLDEEFNVISKPQILDFRGSLITAPSRAEDARLVVMDERLFIIYDDNIDKVITRGGFRVFAAELILADMFLMPLQFELINIECLLRFDGENQNRREKGWVPFDYHGSLLLSYSLNPHIVFYPIFGSNECRTVAYTDPVINWPFGELRGGTPAIQINDLHYLSFFHSSMLMQTEQSQGKMVTHYFMGAYLFETSPPFSITHISNQPIVGKNFYNGPEFKPYWKPILAVFPCGMIINGSDIWVSYGRDDHEIWIAKIDKTSLLNSLIPVVN